MAQCLEDVCCEFCGHCFSMGSEDSRYICPRCGHDSDSELSEMCEGCADSAYKASNQIECDGESGSPECRLAKGYITQEEYDVDKEIQNEPDYQDPPDESDEFPLCKDCGTINCTTQPGTEECNNIMEKK